MKLTASKSLAARNGYYWIVIGLVDAAAVTVAGSTVAAGAAFRAVFDYFCPD